MNATITQVADSIFKATILQQDTLKKFTSGELNDLAHECNDHLLHEEFTVRTAAHMLKANCEFLLGQRGVK